MFYFVLNKKIVVSKILLLRLLNVVVRLMRNRTSINNWRVHEGGKNETEIQESKDKNIDETEG